MRFLGLGRRDLSPQRLAVRMFVGISLVTFVVCAEDTSRSTSATDSSRPYRVKISWKTETETNAFGYFVLRGTKPDELKCINEDNPLHAAGTTTTPAWYRYYDLTVECGATYYYRVEAIDLNGTSKWIIGDPAPVEVKGKPLSEVENSEIAKFGVSFRVEEHPSRDTTTPSERPSNNPITKSDSTDDQSHR